MGYSLWGPKESDTSECNDDGTLYIYNIYIYIYILYIYGEREVFG